VKVQNSNDGGGAASAADRRIEPRYAAHGEVRLLLGGAQNMRVEHMYAALASGQSVTLRIGADSHPARVVWNRIKDDGVESGFYIP
jgi:glyoxylate utilization-related uncharacterized protein